MSTRLKAKQAVALKMCEILHKNGELKAFIYQLGRYALLYICEIQTQVCK